MKTVIEQYSTRGGKYRFDVVLNSMEQFSIHFFKGNRETGRMNNRQVKDMGTIINKIIVGALEIDNIRYTKVN